jgi:hypothetical protein
MQRSTSFCSWTTLRQAAALLVSMLGAAILFQANISGQAGTRVDGAVGHLERCDDFFIDSLIHDLFPGLGFLPLIGGLFSNHDIPDPAWVLVRKGDSSLPKFRSVTGVIRETPHVGDYPGGFPIDNSIGDEAVVNYEDYPDVHDSHDMNFYVRVDPEYTDVISSFGIDSEGRKAGQAGYSPDTLEIEWETGIPTYARTGDGRFFPKWAWPLPGDRIWANGYWVFDCGHEVEESGSGDEIGLRSEIHPPRAVASMREKVMTPPGQTQPITVTSADVYIHGRAGVIIDLLECGGRVLLDNRTCPTRTGQTPRGSDSSDGNVDHDIALDHLGAPINERFQFTICTPPLPPGASADAVVKWHEPVVPDNTIPLDPVLTVQDASGACAAGGYGPKQVLVDIRLDLTSATPDDAYARRIYVGWAAPPRPLRHLRLTINSMKMNDDLDHDSLTPGSDDCECAWFWTTVDKAPQEVIRLSDVANDPDHHMNDFGDGDTMTFTNARWDAILRSDQSLTVRTFGFDGGVGEGAVDPKQDCLDDHFGHHDFPEHIDLGITELPDFCIASLALFDKSSQNDDPFDVMRRELTGADVDSLIGAWPAVGSTDLTLVPQLRCAVTFHVIAFPNIPLVTQRVCESAAQVEAAIEASGPFEVTDVVEYHQYELNVTLESLPVDSDGDGLFDGDETLVHHTNPLDADSDDDGLNDGEEVNTYHTNPLDADTDDDQLSDGDEVHVYHTNPLDPDTDDDFLMDGIEVAVGTDPLDPDTDNDGLVDGRDPDFVALAVSALPDTAFVGGGTRDAFLSQLDAAEKWVAAGDLRKALRTLDALRGHLDGCGETADLNDWIVDCTIQVQIRIYMNVLITNLGG